MKKVALIITIFITCFSTGCKKDKDCYDYDPPEQCWAILTGDYINTTRRFVDLRCNITEQEFLNCTDCGYPGKLRDFVASCDYYDQGPGGPKAYYWEVKAVGATTWTGAYLATEKEANCYLGANGRMFRKK